MASKTPGTDGPSTESDTADSVEGSPVQKTRSSTYVRKAKMAQALKTARRVPGIVFPQWLRTVLVVTLWLGTSLFYVAAISPYITYVSATLMTTGLALFAGLAPHLWPSRTPPWRTVAWAWLVSMLAGFTVLTMEWGRYALTTATVVGFVIVIARTNQNARRFVGLFRTWRAMR